MNINDIKINFQNWLISKGCRNKTEKNRPSTVYEYTRRIDRVCDKFFNSHYEYEWEKLASNIYPILALYLLCQKNAHQKSNVSLDEIYQALSEQNILYSVKNFSHYLKNGFDIDEFLNWLWNEAKGNRQNKIALLKFYEFLRNSEYRPNGNNELNYNDIGKNLSKITSPRDLIYIEVAQYANEFSPKKIVPRKHKNSEEIALLCIQDTADSLECSAKTLSRMRKNNKSALKCDEDVLRYAVDDVHQYLAEHFHASGYTYPTGTYNPKDKKNWCSADEASKIIGCSKSTVVKYREDGELTYTDYTPRHVLYFIPDVKRIRDERKKTPRLQAKKSKI